MEKDIDLNLIDDNPWQPRLSEDAEHIANLAVSIADDGLMQLPTGRMMDNGRVQLAFGHSRKAAYRLLASLQAALRAGRPVDFEDGSALARAVTAADRALELGTGFETMPVHLVELDDESMYRFAVSENIQRRDLSPIETAKAMARYRDEFGKKSTDIGALFGVNDSTVRGTLRLLDLPEPLQDKLAAGEMTVGAARKVLSVKHLMDAGDLLNDRFTTARSIDEIVQAKIENSDLKLITMWSRWSNGEPRGGDTLWPLSWTYKTPPYQMPTEKEFLKIWSGPAEIGGRSVGHIARDVAWAITSNHPGLARTWEQVYQQCRPEERPVVDLVKQLAEPPACTACNYYIRNDGNHLCALKACWTRKFDHWVVNELQKLSKKMGIRPYNAERDGRAFEKLEFHQARDKAWVEAKHPDLRLMIRKSSWKHGYTDSMNVCLVMTGEEVEAIKRAEAEAREKNSGRACQEQWARDSRKRDLYIDASKRFVLEQACPAFAVALDGKVAGGLLESLAGHFHYSTPRGLSHAAQVIFGLAWVDSNAMWHDAWRENSPTPVQGAAKHLQGLARTWGVKLPPDWLEIAARYEPDLSEFPECGVSAETVGVAA